jgi:signal transduction histidine kinase
MNNAFATSHPVENRLENSLGDASHLEQPRNVVVPLARGESGPSESGPLDRNADFVADSPPPPQPMASQDTPAPRTPAPKTPAPKTLAPKTLAPTETAVEISVPLNDEPAGFALDTPLNSHQLFDEAGPVDGLYYYYYPIEFHDQCLACHSQISTPAGRPQLNERSLANGESPRLTAVGAVRPNRVIRVQMDYSDTKVWTLWSFSILTTLGIATLGLTLFIVHWLLRRMVILPVSHLRDVSNSISKGQMDQRAQLDTGDELNELSDAFNRMLRYINETQGQLTTVNAELDSRVDQLAHANLQLFEANRLKSDFLANMSHELRTPLNSILGFSEVLQAFDTLNDKQKKYAANIQKSGRLLLEMINDILDLAKVEAGKMDVRPTHFNVSSVAEGQCDVVRGLAEEKKIDLRFESTDADAMIYQDQPKIQQILTNLLSNAIKFTPDGGMITVSVDTRNESQCVLTVTDSGVGIPPAEIDVVFEKFRQSRAVLQHDGLTREYSGTGLGLSIVKEISRLLGGEVVVESDVGKGSKFSVYLDAHYQPNLDRSQRISLPVPGLNDSPPTLI